MRGLNAGLVIDHFLSVLVMAATFCPFLHSGCILWTFGVEDFDLGILKMGPLRLAGVRGVMFPWVATLKLRRANRLETLCVSVAIHV